MNYCFLGLVVFLILKITSSWPQEDHSKLQGVNFSSALEVNNLEPSAIPELENRSYLNRDRGDNFLESTIEEVQNILKTNPDLPRLTRGEILDLVENITKEDMERLRSLNANRDGKAILLVMPYSPKKNIDNMEELYTRKPVTQIIESEENEEKIVAKQKKTTSRKNILGRNRNRSTYKTTIPTTSSTSTIPASTTEFLYTTLSPSSTISTTPQITTYRPRTRPPRTKTLSTTRPFRRRRITTTPTTVNPRTQDKFLPENALRPTKPPMYRFSRRTTTEIPDLSYAESYAHNVYLKYEPFGNKTKLSNNIHENNNINLEYPKENFVAASTPSGMSNAFLGDGSQSHPIFEFDELSDASHYVTQSKPQTAEAVIPNDFKYIVDDLDLSSALKKGDILGSSIKAATVFPRTTTVKKTDFLITPMPEFEEVADNLSPDMKNLLMTFGLIPNPSTEKTKLPESSGYYPQKAEEHHDLYVGFKPLPEEGVADKEMDAFLSSFGLGRNARKGKKFRKKQELVNRIDLSIIPESMLGIVHDLGFGDKSDPTQTKKGKENHSILSTPKVDDKIDRKDDSISTEDIENINNLHNEISDDFMNDVKGNLSNDNTYSTTEEQISVITAEYVDDSMRNESTLENVNEEISNESELGTERTQTSVVFNPTDQKFAQKEKDQLDKLMELIRTLKNINGSVTEEDFKNFDLETLKQFTEVLNNSQRLTLGEQIADAIDPLNTVDQIIKVKPKRQENSTASDTLSPNLDVTTETMTDSPLLSESFGNFPIDDQEIETTTARKLSSGVYYLIDWNTFLEVDSTRGKRVNLRFQPTVGDPSRFYSINND